MSVSLEVSKRAVRPRSLRNKLRHEGKIPAIVYGYQIESTPISVDAKTLTKALRDHGVNAVISLDVEGKKVNTLLVKTQVDTFTKEFTHLEFLSVDMEEVTELDAEIVLIGEAAGVKVGGVLNQNLYSVLVSATPDNIPERVEVDITKLEIGDAVTIADLPKNDKFTIVTDPEEQILAITEPKAASDIEDETVAAGEPEVIGEKEAK
ncbi:50S ribosomal protein L25/general stress protein Ctc [Enterococcus phoeniculicola]|jgi:large subunit ribosomal protein L25|uniref:Large ribosomal subunit protein bL25 n=1 Tax=Enterococcus phoeniculicola ATCC BAA-412 TaxID=1158610 RepID=R3WLD0_9ENTE|nr:50S ribosomal protein L25/general stress protein Ctc [Enterococcus phoeniculicola]EOL42680.1 ribosomal protein L25, Ctc-form [Enterococcus phoeniculicola ATCC BAA-412]EOT79036.1 ribosomal protein L25, Ctc-form [Enterococcus phoeniculicola ATCC BAA-412]